MATIEELEKRLEAHALYWRFALGVVTAILAGGGLIAWYVASVSGELGRFDTKLDVLDDSITQQETDASAIAEDVITLRESTAVITDRVGEVSKSLDLVVSRVNQRADDEIRRVNTITDDAISLIRAERQETLSQMERSVENFVSRTIDENLTKYEIPVGVVAAFDGPNGCPSGWKYYEPSADRFIIGVGERFTLPYVAGEPRYQTGGSETHTLQLSEMPGHTHVYQDSNVRVVGGRGLGGSGSRGDVTSGDDRQVTETSGEGKPHNNMPPYVALYFCIKA